MHYTSAQMKRFVHAVGDELRAARNGRGWSRRQLSEQMARSDDGEELSLPTLASYELGTRRIALIRVVAMCAVLEVTADELIGRALRRAGRDEHGPHGYVCVDLAALARTRHPHLLPLRRWAAASLRHHEGDTALTKHVGPRALAALADLTGARPADLWHALRALQDTPA